MTAFTRYPSIKIGKATPPIMGGALQSWSQTGKGQHRSVVQQGRVWSETYEIFKADSIDGRAFLAMIELFWSQGTTFTIDHPLLTVKNGGGTGTALVNGGSQTGQTLSTDGWGGTNPILRSGDIIRVAGVSAVRDVTADVNHTAGVANILINPPIYPGESPVDNAVVQFTAVVFNANIFAEPTIPDAAQGSFIGGLRLIFREAV